MTEALLRGQIMATQESGISGVTTNDYSNPMSGHLLRTYRRPTTFFAGPDGLIRLDIPPVVGVDFFCGVGGTTRGFLDAGVDVICGIDIDPTASETYEANNIRPCGLPSVYLPRSVDEVDRPELQRLIGSRDERVLVFIGCAPCQPFTRINTDKSNQGERRILLLSFLREIQFFKPEYVVVENVPDIANEKYGDVFSRFLQGLDDAGYKHNHHIVDARDYGVPQHRERMALVASLRGPVKLPEATHGPKRLPYVAASEAFRYPAIAAGETHPRIPNHQASRLEDINLKRIRAITCPGGSRNQWPPELQLDCYKDRESGYEDVYGRMALNRPAPTLTTKFNSISNGRFGHPTEDRAVSLREGAALQTFPDNFVFKASIKHAAKHIGNAVPVLLARVLAAQIMAHHRCYEFERLMNYSHWSPVDDTPAGEAVVEGQE